jgi:hypothetical protein
MNHPKPLMSSHRSGIANSPLNLALFFAILGSPLEAGATQVSFGPYTSIQINVDAAGQNIVGDAAHEPTIAFNPKNPSNMVVGFKQFFTALSNDRQGGWAYSEDGGLTWTFPGVVTPGRNRTNIAVDVDSDGNFFYQNLHYDATGNFAQDVEVFKSIDGGISWLDPVYAHGEGADKGRMAVDRSGTLSDGFLYVHWREGIDLAKKRFTRSTDHGASFDEPVSVPGDPAFGTIAVGTEGQVYVTGRTEIGEFFGTKNLYTPFLFATSLNARDASVKPVFTTQEIDMGGAAVQYLIQNNPNQFGPLGDVQVAVDHSNSNLRGNIYVMSPVDPPDIDNQDVTFTRSEDGGATWSAPIKINDDAPNRNSFQWFAMQGVAPNSRIDAVWYDTRNSLQAAVSQLYYSYSWDGGRTWSQNRPVTPSFNTHNNYPSGAQKIGDYAGMVSDETGGNISYTATYNGEQDVYYLRVFPDCNNNSQSDVLDIEQRTSGDINANHIPDSCETIAVSGDLDSDGDVDQLDVNLLLASKNKPASGAKDPKDLDKNGVINVLDARKQALLCTRPRCAV